MDAETQAFVQEKTTEIRARMNRTVEDIIAVGKALTEVKERLQHGQFTPWLESEFPLTDRMARYYMQIAERFGENRKFSSDVSFKVLASLASPSMPDEVIDQVTSGQIRASFRAIRKAKAALLLPPAPAPAPPVYEPPAPDR